MSPLRLNLRRRGRGGIFICYRRAETAANAGRLYDRLSERFGEGRVFMDVDSMPLGTDFKEEARKRVSESTVLLAIIGRNWSAVTDEEGRRRLDNPDDLVRVEIETALQQNITVIPVLVDGARLPQASDLPPSLLPLIDLNALELSNVGFRSEAARLIAAVDLYFIRRATSQDTKRTTEKQFAEQREQLDRALAEQREQMDRTLQAQSDQLDRTLAEQRIRTLHERFATAAEQLGSDKPAAVRLAGAYAMAGLADDWVGNRQTCVDVLCAYLRMPYAPDPGEEAPGPERLSFRASREVRHVIMRVITTHLRDGAAVYWQGLNFDFTGVVFDGGDFRGAMFSGGLVSFSGAEFSGGRVDFSGAEFSSGRVDFTSAEFSGGTADFRSVKFSGGRVDFSGAKFSGGRVDFSGAEFSGSEAYFGRAEFSGGEVDFYGAAFSRGTISFESVVVPSGGEVSFRGVVFSGGAISFEDAKFSGGEVSFGGAAFSGGAISFDGAKFSGGTISFGEAAFSRGRVGFGRAGFSGSTVGFRGVVFSGGEVDFSHATDWSHPPEFDWYSPPPGVKLLTEGGGEA